jgi:hypothetical protein
MMNPYSRTMMSASKLSHRSKARRALYSLSAVVIVLAIGTIGFHWIEGVSYVDGFYFESMMAAGQGPPFTLTTDAGKIFASIMGFVSVITVIGSIALNLLPALARLWTEGLDLVEKEAKTLEKDLSRKKDVTET